MAGAHSRRKGAGGEREIVQLAKSFGLRATRTWETAQSRDKAVAACDVRIGERSFQVKRRGGGYAALYGAVAEVSGAFIRSDNRDWLAVVPAEFFLRLLEYFDREETSAKS
jgi:hypothetical protein